MAVVLPSCPARGVGPALMIANGPAGTRIRDRFASRPRLTPPRSGYPFQRPGPAQSDREPRIILTTRRSGAGVSPTPPPGFKSHLGPRFQAVTGEVWGWCSLN